MMHLTPSIRPSIAHFLMPLLLLVLLAALALPSPASAVTAGPASFSVVIDGSPPVAIQPSQDDCRLNGFPPVESVCTIDYRNAETLSSTMTGTVTETESETTGTITLVCAWNLRLHAVTTVTIATMAMTFSELTGGGDQNCTFTISLTDGATLNGTLVGDMALALVPGTPPTEFAFTGSFAVAVVNGTGTYANATGSGTFTQSETMLLPTSSSGGPLPLLRSATGRAATPSSMKLRLASGTPRASIYSPGNSDRIAATSKQVLRVYGSKGMSCTAVAIKGNTTVALGTARDGTPRDGRVIFTKRLSTLARGTWRLRATCTLPRPGLRPVTSIAVRTIVRP